MAFIQAILQWKKVGWLHVSSDDGAVRNTLQHSRWKHFALSVLFFTAAFTVGTFLHWIMGDAAGGGAIFVKFGVIFGLLGAIYGAIYALDIRADSTNFDRPILRTMVCAGLGAFLVLYFQISSPIAHDFASVVIVVIGAGVAGFLGWVGWRWAKYVDF
jgi:hypothetical protein